MGKRSSQGSFRPGRTKVWKGLGAAQKHDAFNSGKKKFIAMPKKKKHGSSS